MSGRAHVPVTELEWALSYRGYERLALGPQALFDHVLAPARHEFERTGSVPSWCGVDLLRGWLYYLQREDHDVGGANLGVEWISVLYAIFDHAYARPADLPPTIFGQRPHALDRESAASVLTNQRGVVGPFDVMWRTRHVGTLEVSHAGLDYLRSELPGLARFVHDRSTDAARRSLAPREAARAVLSALASIPAVEIRSRSASLQPECSEISNGQDLRTTLGPGADYAVAFEPHDDEVIGLLAIDSKNVVFVRSGGEWIEPNSEEWMEKLNGFDTLPVTEAAVGMVDAVPNLTLWMFDPYEIEGNGRL